MTGQDPVPPNYGPPVKGDGSRNTQRSSGFRCSSVSLTRTPPLGSSGGTDTTPVRVSTDPTTSLVVAPHTLRGPCRTTTHPRRSRGRYTGDTGVLPAITGTVWRDPSTLFYRPLSLTEVGTIISVDDKCVLSDARSVTRFVRPMDVQNFKDALGTLHFL